MNLFGLPADYDKINMVATANNLKVVEDAAQSFGAEYKNQKSGSLGDIACTSFFPAKPLGGYGDGGMCFTSDDELAAKMRSIRVHGEGTERYEHARLGFNGRLDAFQAAVLLAKLELFEEELNCVTMLPGAIPSDWRRWSHYAGTSPKSQSLPDGVGAILSASVR